MAKPLTPITVERLVAIGGVVEDTINVRFGKEMAYEASGTWYLCLSNFRWMEDVIGWLKVYGKLIGFEMKETP